MADSQSTQPSSQQKTDDALAYAQRYTDQENAKKKAIDDIGDCMTDYFSAGYHLDTLITVAVNRKSLAFESSHLPWSSR